MVRFGRLTEVYEGCRVEFDHLYVWPSGYEAVDVRFINMRGRSEVVRQNVYDASRRLFFLNQDAHLDKVLGLILKARRKASADGGCALSEDDVRMVVEMVWAEGLWMKPGVSTKRYVEWKPAVYFGFTRIQVDAIKRIAPDGEDVAFKYAKRKRQAYAMKCLGQVRQMGATDMVTAALMELREATITEVSIATGLSYQRVRRAFSELGIMKPRPKDVVEMAVMKLVQTGRRVSVSAVCREAGVSPQTARKYLGGLDVS